MNTPIAARRYTLREIDEMRGLLETRDRLTRWSWSSFGGSSSDRDAKEREEELRTLLVAGVTPAELRRDVKRLRAEATARREAERKAERDKAAADAWHYLLGGTYKGDDWPEWLKTRGDTGTITNPLTVKLNFDKPRPWWKWWQ